MRNHRRCRPLAALPFTAVIVLAVAGPAGSASASPLGKPDLFTAQGINQYLLIRGVNPAAAVRQTGLLNYVGKACPGKQWHCLAPTHAPVVQVAPRGGVNVYQCSARPGRNGSCFVLQVNAGAPPGSARKPAGSPNGGPSPGTNQYVCLQYASSDTAVLNSSGCAMNQVNTTGDNDAAVGQLTVQNSAGPQSASETVGTSGSPLTQTNQSGNNRIVIGQVSQQKNSDTPTADQTTSVSQANGTGQNQAFLQQQVQQQVSDGAAAQDQEAQQAICLTQDSQSGPNQAVVKPDTCQDEQDSAEGATQNQDQEYGPTIVECGNYPFYADANLSAVVQQDENTAAATGPNQEKLWQNLREQEQTTATSGTVSQVQGDSTYGGAFGGLYAVPNQQSTGLSKSATYQNEQQTMHAAGPADQEQFDPIRQPPGEGLQESNAHDVFQLFQNGIQLAGASAAQYYDLEGDCVSSGSCDVQQQATSNTGTTPMGCTSTGTGCYSEDTNSE